MWQKKSTKNKNKTTKQTKKETSRIKTRDGAKYPTMNTMLSDPKQKFEEPCQQCQIEKHLSKGR